MNIRKRLLRWFRRLFFFEQGFHCQNCKGFGEIHCLVDCEYCDGTGREARPGAATD